MGRQIDRTNTIFFVHKHEIPQDRLKDVTYIKFVVSVCTEKDDPNRIRATLGGNLIHYPDNVGTPIADLLLIKKIPEQRHFKRRSQICHSQPLQLLPHDTTQAT